MDQAFERNDLIPSGSTDPDVVRASQRQHAVEDRERLASENHVSLFGMPVPRMPDWVRGEPAARPACRIE
jgi:hypothetical protein